MGILKAYLLFLFFIIFDPLLIGNSTDEVIEHHIKKGLEREFIGREELRVMKVHQSPDIEPGNQFYGQIVAVNTLVYSFNKIDPDFLKNEFYPLFNMLVLNVRIIFFQIKSHGRTYISKLIAHLFTHHQ